jgi:hypothetical protein
MVTSPVRRLLSRALARALRRGDDWQRLLDVAAEAGDVLRRNVEQAQREGRVTPAAAPLYAALGEHSTALLREILSSAPLRAQLAGAAMPAERAVIPAYLQLVAQLMWDVFRAYQQEPKLAERTGLAYPALAEEYVRAAGVPAEMVVASVNSAEETMGDASRGDEAERRRQVVARQALDVLQTLTQGYYTRAMWRSSAAANERLLATILGRRATFQEAVRRDSQGA